MYYSDDAISKLAEGYSTLNSKLNNLLEKYILLDLKNSRAREFARQGFPRRLKLMVHCIARVFDKIPPERSELPSRSELSDATVNIQSFVFNAFGAVDNLAWIWTLESGQKRHDGTPIPDTHIGLGPKNISVRATLSDEFQAYLKSLEAWFNHLADLRHALAHRIPLYIPPYIIRTEDEGAYREFETQMMEASKRGDHAEFDRLSVEQLRLGQFRPWIQHSFEENSQPVVFHAQMIADFNTIDEIAQKMLGEFPKLRSA